MMVILGLNPAQNYLCDCDVHLMDIIKTLFFSSAIAHECELSEHNCCLRILSFWCMCVPGKSCSGFVQVWRSLICIVHGDVRCVKHVQSAYIGMAFWL